MKPKVGIFTTFTGQDEAYSLVSVVKTQIQMFLDADYDVAVFVTAEFEEEGLFSSNYVDIRKTLPYNSKSEEIADKLLSMVSDIDVMLCHDIVFLSQHKEWGEAIRTIAETSKIAWLHWQHSRGGGKVDPVNNSWYCYPNKGDLAHVAGINQTSVDRVRYVPHPLDFDYLGWSGLAVRIADETGYNISHVSAILPTRLDRQKQIEKAVRLFAGIKKAGKSVCFIVADAFATGDRFQKYEDEVEEIAKREGLNIGYDFLFLSRKYPECRLATPRDTVKALFEMSNLFILPSNAETSSLVAMEAALAGNLLVLNGDFPPIHHLYEKALTLPFGSIFEDTKYYRTITTADGRETQVLDPQLFFDDQAKDLIVPVLESQISLQVRKQILRDRWPKRVFKSHLEPLILEAYQKVHG